MHSGYYYKLSRLKVSPPKNYLRSLTIFKWQSYLTFITGILLLGVIYYYKSNVLMVDKRVLLISPAAANALGIITPNIESAKIEMSKIFNDYKIKVLEIRFFYNFKL